MKLKEIAKELKAEYVSANIDGKNYSFYAKSSINADVEVPKGIKFQYKLKDGPWKEKK